MRPTTKTYDGELYECYVCGRRVEEADTRVCPACGSDLRQISHSRDL